MVNSNFLSFKKIVSNKLKFNLFLLTKLPLVFLCGIKVNEINFNKAQTTVKYKWINQNPFGSLYFAVLSMAAELSTGLLAFANIYNRKPAISMLITKMEATYFKKATGTILFTCNDGIEIAKAIEDAMQNNMATKINCTSIATNEDNEVVAQFKFEWSFKSKHVK